jgi:hypothetical protein
MKFQLNNLNLNLKSIMNYLFFHKELASIEFDKSSYDQFCATSFSIFMIAMLIFISYRCFIAMHYYITQLTIKQVLEFIGASICYIITPFMFYEVFFLPNTIIQIIIYIQLPFYLFFYMKELSSLLYLSFYIFVLYSIIPMFYKYIQVLQFYYY